MAKVVDKSILLVAGAFFVFQVEDLIAPVAALLVAIIVSALGIYVANRKFRMAGVILFVLLCFVLPELTYFLPVLFYECVWDRFYWGAVGILPLLIQRPWEMGDGTFLLWILFTLTGVLFALRTERVECLEQKLITIRDTSTELNLILKEKNKNLMEKQDYEIYLATLRERNRIAREIHDNVGHMLSRSILQVGALAAVHKEEPLHGQLFSVNDTLNQAMTSIRESVHDLHDDSIDLKQAVMDVAESMKKSYNVTIDYDMTKQVPRNIKYCFISVIKEAVSNIMKHSDADRVSLILREHPGFYQLSIEDNGMSNAVSLEGGIGLGNMKERVEGLGGTFRVHTKAGFKIFVSICKERAGEKEKE